MVIDSKISKEDELLAEECSSVLSELMGEISNKRKTHQKQHRVDNYYSSMSGIPLEVHDKDITPDKLRYLLLEHEDCEKLVISKDRERVIKPAVNRFIDYGVDGKRKWREIFKWCFRRQYDFCFSCIRFLRQPYKKIFKTILIKARVRRISITKKTSKKLKRLIRWTKSFLR